MNWWNRLGQSAKPKPYDVLHRLGLTEHDLCRHFFLCGETGSGKTSVLRILLKAFLWMVYPGGVHCCVKADEAHWICKLVRTTPMRDRLLHLVPGQFTFNIAAYELCRQGGNPETFTRLLQRLNDQRNRTSGNDDEKNFWKNLFFDYMHFGITIVWLAHGPNITLEHIHQFISTSPNSLEEAKSQAFLNTPCWKMLRAAESNAKTSAEIRAYERACDFYIKIQTQLGSKARAAGVQECASILAPFLLSPFYETFCASESSFTPDMPLDQYYTVIDAPVLIHGPAAQLMQNVICTMTIDAALRQTKPRYYTLIVRDEMHMLAGDPLYETLVHSVARSHGLSFWSAVQNLPLLTSSLGGDARAEMHMKSLIANYGTKFILANSCMDVTNRFFSTMCGQHKEHFNNFNEQESSDPRDFLDATFGSAGFRFGSNTSYADRIPPDRFLHLRRGGPPDFLIDAYMAGRVFPETGLPFKLVTFSQR